MLFMFYLYNLFTISLIFKIVNKRTNQVQVVEIAISHPP